MTHLIMALPRTALKGFLILASVLLSSFVSSGYCEFAGHPGYWHVVSDRSCEVFTTGFENGDKPLVAVARPGTWRWPTYQHDESIPYKPLARSDETLVVHKAACEKQLREEDETPDPLPCSTIFATIWRQVYKKDLNQLKVFLFQTIDERTEEVMGESRKIMHYQGKPVFTLRLPETMYPRDAAKAWKKMFKTPVCTTATQIVQPLGREIVAMRLSSAGNFIPLELQIGPDYDADSELDGNPNFDTDSDSDSDVDGDSDFESKSDADGDRGASRLVDHAAEVRKRPRPDDPSSSFDHGGKNHRGDDGA